MQAPAEHQSLYACLWSSFQRDELRAERHRDEDVQTDDFCLEGDRACRDSLARVSFEDYRGRFSLSIYIR